MAILLSIIIPAYNVENYIEDCLNSILALRMNDYEVIVVNDGSTDNTKGIVDKYASKLPNLISLEQTNQGASVARNTGFVKASGEYVFFCDSDDYIDAEKFESLFQSCYSKKLDIAIGNGLNLYSDGPKGQLRAHDKVSALGIVSGDKYYIVAERSRNFFISVSVKIYKTEFLRKYDLNFVPHIMHEDEEFAPRVFALAERVEYINEHFYIRRHRENSVTKNARHKYYNLKSSPSFCQVMKSLEAFKTKIQLSDSQLEVINMALSKAYLEILRRELYYSKEKLTNFRIGKDQKKELKNIIKRCKLSLLQRMQIQRFEIKVMLQNII